jgi:SulP family sulfate permease
MMVRPTFKHLHGDFTGGITAAVVALPLALAFGVASGAGPVAGIYGAIWVGLFAALFGGTPAQVSGPTGPMTVVMAAVFVNFAYNPALAFTVVMLGGVFQILFGVAKLGRYINLMPYPVISGFMSGIGLLIIAIQLAPLLGHASPAGALNCLAALPGFIKDLNHHALLLGVFTLILVFFLPKRLTRFIPAPLFALICCTLLAVLFLPEAPMLGEIPRGLPVPHLPTFEWASLREVIFSALMLAVLGSIDSLLTALIADNVTQTSHDSDKELVGQGIGNLVAGFMGAIAGAGATMRTMTNIRAGGRTNLSGIIHALFLLAMVLGLGGFAAYIPHAVLAGILLKVGIEIIDWNYLRRIKTAPLTGVFLMFSVLLLTVFDDLITAVAVGTVMASLLFVKSMADLQVDNINILEDESIHSFLTSDENDILKFCQRRVTMLHLTGPMSFGAANGMARKVGDITLSEVMILDLTDVPIIDCSASLALENIIRQAGHQEITVLLVGVNLRVAQVLGKLGVMPLVREQNRHASRLAALQQATEILGLAPPPVLPEISTPPVLACQS